MSSAHHSRCSLKHYSYHSPPLLWQLEAVTVVVGSVLASNASDGQMTLFTPYSSDQMIINLSMKIGEVDSGPTRLLCDSNIHKWGREHIKRSLSLFVITERSINIFVRRGQGYKAFLFKFRGQHATQLPFSEFAKEAREQLTWSTPYLICGSIVNRLDKLNRLEHWVTLWTLNMNSDVLNIRYKE